MKRKRNQKYAAVFLATLAGLLCSIALATTLIDPYGRFGTFPALEKHKAGVGTMNSKVAIAARGNFRTLFIGSSRTAVGLDPESPVLAPDARAYNFGLPACGLIEMEAALKFAIAKNPSLEFVLIDIAPNYFSADFQPSPELARSLLNPGTSRIEHELGLSLGADSLEYAAETLADARVNAPPVDTVLGLRLLSARLPADYNARKVFLRYFAPTNNLLRIAKSPYVPERMEHVRRMLTMCRERNIETVLFISPGHASRLLWSMSQPDHAGITQVKRDLVTVVDGAAKAGGRVRLFDFSLPVDANIEPIPMSSATGLKLQNYIDPTHFVPVVGNRILKQVLPERLQASGTEELQPMGVVLNADNVEKVIAQQAERLKNYAASLRESDPELHAKLTTRFE